MIKLWSHRQREDSEFCQLRIEELEGTGLLSAGFLTLTIDEAKLLAALIALGARAINEDVVFKETIYGQDRTLPFCNHSVDQLVDIPELLDERIA